MHGRVYICVFLCQFHDRKNGYKGVYCVGLLPMQLTSDLLKNK